MSGKVDAVASRVQSAVTMKGVSSGQFKKVSYDFRIKWVKEI